MSGQAEEPRRDAKWLRRHMLVSHGWDGAVIDIAPDGGLAVEHRFDHEDGVPEGVEHSYEDVVLDFDDSEATS